MSHEKVDVKYQVYDTTAVQRELEERIINYNGQDPLEVWWHYITFLEQCVKSSSDNKEVREKLKLVVSRCFELFFSNPMYKNDERLVQVYIKQIKQLPQEKHLPLLQQMLDRGFGQMVSLMYLHIAAAIEMKEGPGSTKAINVLEKGIISNAQPSHLLFDALREIQMRIPSKNLHTESNHFDPHSSSSSQVKSESFAIPRMTQIPQENHKEKVNTEQKEPTSSVHGLNNGTSSLVKESSNIEEINGLKTQSNSSIQTSSSTNHPSRSSSSSSTPWKIMYQKDKLRLGTPNEITFDHLRAQKYLQKRGLKTPIAVRDEEKTLETMKQLEKVKVDLAVENEVLAKEKENDALKKKLKEYEDHYVQLMEKQQKDAEIIKQNNILISQLEETISKMKLEGERQIEHLASVLRNLEKQGSMSENEILKAKQNNIELQILLRQEKETVNELLKEKEEMRKNFEEEKLKMQQNFDRERNESLLNFSQRLEQSLARQEIEQSLGLANESKKYGNVTNNSFVVRQQQPQQSSSQYGEINSIKYSPPSSCRTPAPKLPFTLYESNFEMTAAEEYSMSQAGGKSLTSFPQHTTGILQQQQQDQENIPPINNENEIPLSNLKVETETPAVDVFAVPAPRPRLSITKQNNKVAISNLEMERKQIRCENENVIPFQLDNKDDNSMDLEDEEDIILKGQEETGIDFNVSDLTTNLRFARPLVNSTPEKVPFSFKPSGMMSNMPLSFDHGSENGDRYIPVKRLIENRKSKLFRAFLPPPPPVPLFHEADEQQQQEQRPIIYEEINDTEDKENYVGTTTYEPENTHCKLSPISETSKERWSSHSSGSGNSHDTS